MSADTIRYYEKRKLLPGSARSAGGFRLFAVETIERVRFIKQAQEVGFSLDEINALLTGGEIGACGLMRDLLRAKPTAAQRPQLGTAEQFKEAIQNDGQGSARCFNLAHLTDVSLGVLQRSENAQDIRWFLPGIATNLPQNSECNADDLAVRFDL